MSIVSVELPLDLIEVRERSRAELRRIDELAASIGARGLLHPPVVRRDGEAWVLVAGLRRLEALRQLGWEKTPVTIAVALTDERAALHAEGEENTCREPFTRSEAVRHAGRIAEVERRLAKERHREGSARGGRAEGSQEFGEPSLDRHARESATRTARAVGMSAPTLNKAAEVVEAAEAEPEKYGPLVDQMDTTGKVEPAYKKLRKAKAAEAEQAAYEQAVAEFPELGPDRSPGLDTKQVVQVAEDLRSVPEGPERDKRRQAAATWHRAVNAAATRDDGPDPYLIADQIVGAVRAMRGEVERAGGADALAAGVETAEVLAVETWAAEIADASRLLQTLAHACRPTLRRVK